jgi:Flp pilus assembly protein TadG
MAGEEREHVETVESGDTGGGRPFVLTRVLPLKETHGPPFSPQLEPADWRGLYRFFTITQANAAIRAIVKNCSDLLNQFFTRKEQCGRYFSGVSNMVIRSFWRSRSGNFAMMFALMLPAVLGAVGLAVDFASMTKAQSKLQNAIDAAVLAASRINDKATSREQIFQDFLAANIAGEPTLANVTANIEIDTGLNYISTEGSAVADVELQFGLLFGEARRIKVTASAYESRNDLEVVLALDNTGSMGSARMAELRKAATSLVDILALAHSPDSNPKRVVKAALVPFVTAVNVKGEGFSDSWIDGYKDASKGINREAKAKYHGAYFEPVSGKAVNHFDLFDNLRDNSGNKIEWKGCVEARPAPYNLSDDAPNAAVPDTLFVPYFAPDNPGAKGQSPNKSDRWNNSYLTDNFTANNNTDKRRLRDSTRYRNVAASNRYIDSSSHHQPRTTGPNYACPTPIMPLTSDFTKLKTEISKMIHWEGSGTNVSEGMAWSYRVLSPGEPYSQGAPFKSENNSKFVVVFTDGENTVFGASNETHNKSDYGAYGMLDADNPPRFGTTNRNTALTQVNTWTLAACTSLKAQEVEVFTVLLGADTAANRTLYSKCATTPEHYYPTSDVSQLDGVFKKIAARIAKLYVTN